MARPKRQYGSGALLKRRKGWAIRWRENEIAPDGRKTAVLRYENLGDVSKTEAVRTLRLRVAQAGSPRLQRPRVTFATFANDWQVQVVPMYKHSTQKNHVHILAKHLLPRFRDTPLTEVSRQHVQAYVAQLVRDGYAPRTIDHIHDVLSAVLRTAVKWGHLTENPALNVDLPALKTVRPKWVLTESQTSALLEKLPPLAKTMVGLALLTGLRRGELFALRWKDVGDGDTILSVHEAVYEGRFDTPKTEAGKRRVPLSPPARALFSDWRSRARRSEPDDLVFATGSGKPISPNNVLRAAVFPACMGLGLPRATWLTFRRTYASWAHDLGMPGKVIAQLMGHAKVDTTLNVYAQVLDGSVRKAAERVGSRLITIDHNAREAATVTH
jgi:integrase